jgi:hypothetical protein
MTSTTRDASWASWHEAHKHLRPEVLAREAFLFGLTLGRNDHVRQERAPRERFDHADFAAEANHHG